MAKNRGLTFDEIQKIAMENYENGGDVIVECWDIRTYNDYIDMFGPITKTVLKKMFKWRRDELKEIESTIW